MKINKFFVRTPLRISFERILKKRLPKHAEKVLEIGIECYRYGKQIKSQVYHSLDIDRKFNPNFVADCHNMSMIQDNTYDIVLLFGVLEHCIDPHKVILEIKRIMAGGGANVLF